MRNPLISSLANRQFKLTILGGVALVPLVSLAFALLMFRPWASRWPDDFPFLVKLGSQTLGLCGVFLTTGILPALLAGWLRLAPMRWLLGRILVQPRSHGVLLAVAGTLLLFEVTVVVASLLGYWLTATPFFILFNTCTAFSLPWLIAALWATRRVLRQPILVVE